MNTNIYIAIYCLLSALAQFLLGIAWDGFDPVHRAIKWFFLFASVWGFFFGVAIIKGLL